MIMKGILGLQIVEVLYEMDQLEAYLGVSENYLHKAAAEFIARVDKQKEELSAEELEEFYEFYEEDYWRYSQGFHRLLRNSFVILAYSLLEHQIEQICKILKRECKIPISLSDLKGDVIGRSKLYFKKLAGLDFPSGHQNQIWQEINSLAMIRNCIVHNNGLLKGFREEQELRTYTSKKGIISQDTIREEIALTERFCRDIIETMRTFFKELYKTWENHKLQTPQGHPTQL